MDHQAAGPTYLPCAIVKVMHASATARGIACVPASYPAMLRRVIPNSVAATVCVQPIRSRHARISEDSGARSSRSDAVSEICTFSGTASSIATSGAHSTMCNYCTQWHNPLLSNHMRYQATTGTTYHRHPPLRAREGLDPLILHSPNHTILVGIVSLIHSTYCYCTRIPRRSMCRNGNVRGRP